MDSSSLKYFTIITMLQVYFSQYLHACNVNMMLLTQTDWFLDVWLLTAINHKLSPNDKKKCYFFTIPNARQDAFRDLLKFIWLTY